jgi:HAD superfamily hydrolase (TIGR01456 family)
MRGRCVLLGRFESPWTRRGATPERFFGGVLTSSNPLARHERFERRRAEMNAEVEVEMCAQQSAQQQMENFQLEVERNDATTPQEKHDFLPLGAAPDTRFWGRIHKWADDNITHELREPPHWVAEHCAVVFDVDGVLRSTAVGTVDSIANSAVAVKHLKRHGVAVLYMTNAAGSTESSTAQTLSTILGVHVEPNEVLLSTSPMRHFSNRCGKATLVIGPAKSVVAIADAGFPAPVSCETFMNSYPERFPLRSASSVEQCTALFDCVIVASVFHGDALSEIQAITDVVTQGLMDRQRLPLLFAADDVLFPSFRGITPRLGPGCYREMLHSIFESVTGSQLKSVPYGKPRRVSFVEARNRLTNKFQRDGRDPDALHSIFMVGDNLESDILGANAMGKPWQSVHVRSGLGHAASAARLVPPHDLEAAWMQHSVTKQPAWSCLSACEFVAQLCQSEENEILERHLSHYPPPFPVDLRQVYGL